MTLWLEKYSRTFRQEYSFRHLKLCPFMLTVLVSNILIVGMPTIWWKNFQALYQICSQSHHFKRQWIGSSFALVVFADLKLFSELECFSLCIIEKLSLATQCCKNKWCLRDQLEEMAHDALAIRITMQARIGNSTKLSESGLSKGGRAIICSVFQQSKVRWTVPLFCCLISQ